jgi:hypothetical protein
MPQPDAHSAAAEDLSLVDGALLHGQDASRGRRFVTRA